MNVRMQGAECRPPFSKDRIDLLVYRVWPDDALDILHGPVESIGLCSSRTSLTAAFILARIPSSDQNAPASLTLS